MCKRLTAALVTVLCLSILTVASMTASATEDSSDIPTGSASDSGTPSGGTGSEDNESDGSSSEASSGDSSDSSGTSSDTDSDSSEDGTSSDTDSSDTESSGTTSSRPNRPIHSGGNYDNDHFIDQDFTSGVSSSSKVETTSSEVSSIVSSQPYVEDDYSDEEHFVGKAESLADGVYKYIWIPAGIAVLCVGGLITVNILFRRKYPKSGGGVKNSHGVSSSEAPHRRRKR